MPRPREFQEEKVLEDAMEAFWTHGYNATSMRQLVTATGILAGSLHQAFGGKRELFLAALDHYIQRSLDGLSAALARDGSVLGNIRECLHYVACDNNPGERAKGCLVVNTAAELAPHDPEVTAKVRTMFRRMEDLFAGALTRAQEDGEVPEDKDIRALARYLVIFIEGIRIYGKVQPPGRGLADALDMVLAACR